MRRSAVTEVKRKGKTSNFGWLLAPRNENFFLFNHFRVPCETRIWMLR